MSLQNPFVNGLGQSQIVRINNEFEHAFCGSDSRWTGDAERSSSHEWESRGALKRVDTASVAPVSGSVALLFPLSGICQASAAARRAWRPRNTLRGARATRPPPARRSGG